jgi:hypothetical protein
MYDKVPETKKPFWKHLEVLLFSLICLFSVKTVQNSKTSQLPNASKCYLTAKTVSWSPALCHIKHKTKQENYTPEPSMQRHAKPAASPASKMYWSSGQSTVTDCPPAPRNVTLESRGYELRVQGSGFRVRGSGFRVQGAGCRVQGSWCRV